MSKGVRRWLFWLGGLVLLVVVVLLFLVRVPDCCSRSISRRVRCANNLKQIGLALKMYAGDHKEMYPVNLSDSGRYLAYQPKVFICYGSGNRAGDIKTVDEWTDYVYLSGLSEAVPPDTILMYCSPKNHEWEIGNILFADGHVEAFKSVASKGYSDKQSSFEDMIRTVRKGWQR